MDRKDKYLKSECKIGNKIELSEMFPNSHNPNQVMVSQSEKRDQMLGKQEPSESFSKETFNLFKGPSEQKQASNNMMNVFSKKNPRYD